MKSSKKALLLAMVFLTVVVLVYFGIRAEKPISSDGSTFRIGVLSWVGFGPFFVADEMGLFEKEGLDVEIIKIEEAAPLWEALSSGRVHGIIGTIDSLATAIGSGLPAKVILKIDESCGSDGIVATSEIKCVKDLKGKRVAFPKGIPSHFFLLYLLEKEGLTSDDIISENMEAGNAAAAFVAGKVDAAVTWEPWLSKADNTEHGHIIVTSKECPGVIVDLFAVHKDVLETRPEDARRLLRGWFGALRCIEEEPDKCHEIIGKSLAVNPAEVKDMLGGLRFASYEDNMKYFGLGEDKPCEFPILFNAAGDLWTKEGLLDNPVDGENAYSASALQELY